ncbi:unnamed protein product [Oppiella nova]|uniref:Uncharacterized protein n=1 Tax=Oppiella nova TaxID=334625 RepID=A0A7R9MHQ9_9ACAR|nr:unnamed protein product [Oppiella nova]CAG2176419.1 unnamed protein product [Oppiella nova]
MDSSPPVARISVVDSDLNGHPVCRHGPTLLLQEMSPKTNRRYYCCSSCRNRKDCDFYMSSEEWIQIQTNPKLKAKYLRKLVDMKSQSDDNRKYIATKCLKQMADNGIKFCRNCSLIISSVNELSDHKSHEVLSGITGRQLREPTKLMNNKTLEFIVNDILAKNGFQSVFTSTFRVGK